MASGSGVANTVAMGSIACPMLQSRVTIRAAPAVPGSGRHRRDNDPPVIGAAACLIAEFLKISYVDVIFLATIPAALSTRAFLLMVKNDAKKFGLKAVQIEKTYTLGQLTKRYGYQFLRSSPSSSSLSGVLPPGLRSSPQFSPASSAPSSEGDALHAYQANKGAEGRVDSVLDVAAICAAAGIIVGTVSLTGLGLKLSTIIIGYAGGSLLFTAIFAGIILWIIGLAVPITATYIIAAVIVAPP